MGLTKLELRIRDYLYADSEFTTIKDLADDLEVSLTTINPAIQRLWSRGLLACLCEHPEPIRPENQKVRWRVK